MAPKRSRRRWTRLIKDTWLNHPKVILEQLSLADRVFAASKLSETGTDYRRENQGLEIYIFSKWCFDASYLCCHSQAFKSFSLSKMGVLTIMII